MSSRILDRWTLTLVGALLCALMAGSASVSCSGDGDVVAPPTTGPIGSGGAAGGTTTTGTGGDLFGGNSPTDFVSLEIAPADPVIVVENGVIPAPFEFEVLGHTAGGQVVPTAGTWSFDRYDLGTIGELSGQLTVAGLLGGVGTVTVTLGGLSATTTATVRVHFTSEPEPIGDDIKQAFDQATVDDPALSLLYPYDRLHAWQSRLLRQ